MSGEKSEKTFEHLLGNFFIFKHFFFLISESTYKSESLTAKVKLKLFIKLSSVHTSKLSTKTDVLNFQDSLLNEVK